MDPNPYESPQETSPPPPQPISPERKLSAGRIALMVVLCVLSLPAAAIAAVTTCIATWSAAGPDGANIGFLSGSLAGLLCLVGSVVLIVRLSRPAR